MWQTSNRKSSNYLTEKNNISLIFILALSFLRYGVFALGSTAYPKFCAFGKWLDLALKRLDATRLVPVGLGEELGDRDGEFNKWMKNVYQKACLEFGVIAHDARSGSAEPKVSR